VPEENEKNLSAEQQATEENARFPRPDEDQRRSRSPQEQKAQGQKARFCRMSERLRPCERIRRNKDFISLYKNGQRFRGRYFSVVFRANDLGYSRLAVVVSKKVGPAVARNRVKRLIRNIFRRSKSLIDEPADIIIVARKEILDLTTADLRAGYIQATEWMRRKRTAS
jgi:ribonuclease P protein component